MLFDTHAHLDDRRFDLDREELLSRLPEQGIGLLMNPGCDLPSSQAASALARRVDWIYAAVGSHPDAADQIGDEVLQRREIPRSKPLGRLAWIITMRMYPGSSRFSASGSKWLWPESWICR